MTNTKWTLEGGIFFPINGNIVLHTTPGPGIWTVVEPQDPMDPRLGLTKVADKFEFNYKIYELGHEAITKKVKTIWNSEKFIETNKNLGVVLNGTKGTGKTIAAKLMCNEIGIPVIIVNNSFGGKILSFIQQLNFECIILIDEAEKSFKQDGDDEILLKLIDGVYNSTRKLYILTTNRLIINENLLGRPGRIRYIQEFKNLPIKAVSDYIDDNLIDKSKKEKILQEIDLLEISTIDILKSIVEEVNIFGDVDESNLMNIPKAKYIFDVVKLSGCSKNSIPQIKILLDLTKKQGQDLYSWYNTPINPKELLLQIQSMADTAINVKTAKDDINTKNIEIPVVGKMVNGDCLKNIEREDLRQCSTFDANKLISEEDSEEDFISINELLRRSIKECTWAGSYKMTGQFGNLWKDMETSLGTIVEIPDNNGFFILRDKWEGEETLYLMLRQRNNPSLYRGGLGLML